MEEKSYEKLNIKKKRWKLKIVLLFLLFFVFIVLGFEGITVMIRPSLIALCNVKSRSLANTISGKAVQDVMKNIGYLDLVTLDRDENGSILALRANVIEMNRISSEISTLIQDKYSELEDIYIKIPIGNFTGNELLAGRGPRIVVKIMPVGTVDTEYKTEFISTGINQTRHRVFLEIKSKMTIVAPFTNKTVEVVNNVDVAETVLIGDVPDTFYNLQGINDFTTDDTMNMM